MRPYEKLPRWLAALVLALVVAAAMLGAPTVARADDETDEAESSTTYSADVDPELTASYVLLVELETDTTLYELDADAQAYPASLTKVMTALLVLENGDLDDEVTIESSDFSELSSDASRSGLSVGDTVSVRDLLACLLLPSGNDAAYALARYVSGDWESFVELMNERAAELGCTGTHFVNPCGLHDDDHYTTARDLLLIFEAALEHEEFCEISSASSWDVSITSRDVTLTVYNSDDLVDPDDVAYYEGVYAGKTGYTGSAGRCLVVACEVDGRTLVGVVMGSSNTYDDNYTLRSFTDMTTLLDWGYEAWKTEEVVLAGDVVGVAAVELSKDGDEVDVVSTGSVVATVPAETTFSDLTFDLGLTEALVAAVEEGQDLGTATVSLGDRVLGTVGIVTADEMRLSIPAFVIDWLSDPVHALIAAGVFIAFVIVLGLASSNGRRQREARQRERARATRAHMRY